MHKDGEDDRWLQSLQNSHSGFPRPSRDLKGDRSKCCLPPGHLACGTLLGKEEEVVRATGMLSTWHRKGTRSKVTLMGNKNNFSILGP